MRYHILRANYVAYLFRHADQLMLGLESAEKHGWDANGNVVWSESCYPDDISDLLQHEETDDSASSSENDYEDDMDIELEDITDF